MYAGDKGIVTDQGTYRAAEWWLLADIPPVNMTLTKSKHVEPPQTIPTPWGHALH